MRVTRPSTATAEKLRAAAALVEQGWTQGKMEQKGFFTRRVKYCIYGAVIAAGIDSTDFVVLTFRDEELDRIGPMTWNDDPGRTQKEVVAKLLELADKVETDV